MNSAGLAAGRFWLGSCLWRIIDRLVQTIIPTGVSPEMSLTSTRGRRHYHPVYLPKLLRTISHKHAIKLFTFADPNTSTSGMWGDHIHNQMNSSKCGILNSMFLFPFYYSIHRLEKPWVAVVPDKENSTSRRWAKKTLSPKCSGPKHKKMWCASSTPSAFRLCLHPLGTRSANTIKTAVR